MKVQLKTSKRNKPFNLIKYIRTDLIYREAKSKLEKIQPKCNEVTKQLDINFTDINKVNKMVLEYLKNGVDNKNSLFLIIERQKSVRINILKLEKEAILLNNEITAINVELQIKEELKSRAKKMICRFKEIKGNTYNLSDIQLLIDKIVKEENLSSINDVTFLKLGNGINVHSFIEPVIDFNVTNKIVITDFNIYPIFSIEDFKELCNTKKMNLNN